MPRPKGSKNKKTEEIQLPSEEEVTARQRGRWSKRGLRKVG